MALHAPIAEIMAQVSQILDGQTKFNPATARATIRTATGDPGVACWGCSLVRRPGSASDAAG
jgi:hypothetical protein